MIEFLEALDRYKNDVGEFPERLDALAHDPGLPGWKGPYLRHGVPLDPWGHPYVYRKVPEILSFGADGVAGGIGPNADISSLHLGEPDDDMRSRRLVFLGAAAGFFGLLLLPRLVRGLRAGRTSTH